MTQTTTSPREVLIGVSGGIACYKVAPVVSKLAQRGCAVRVAMTEAATRFVTPLTFRSLSGREVVTDMWSGHEDPASPHVAFARMCNVMLIAPASADMIAKLASGLCHDVVSLAAAALPVDTPLLLAPAMNAEMWANPINQRNVQTLVELRGVTLIGPEEGWQACRTQGMGRMSEPEAILAALEPYLG